jgi:hypothetical protein
MRPHRFLTAIALTLALAVFALPASAANVTLTLSPAGPTAVAPGDHVEFDLTIETDIAIVLDNLTVDIFPSPPGQAAGDPTCSPACDKPGFGFGGLFPGFSDNFVNNDLGSDLPPGSHTFTSFFDVFVDLTALPGDVIDVDAKYDLTCGEGVQDQDCLAEPPLGFESNHAFLVVPQDGRVPEPGTLTLLAIGGLAGLYVRARRRGGKA